jgi:hypothetical protein
MGLAEKEGRIIAAPSATFTIASGRLRDFIKMAEGAALFRPIC